MEQLLSTARYSWILDAYRSRIEEDADYLSYHWMSTSLKLQFLLKLNDLPLLEIGECFNGVSGECCLVTALREAIKRRESDTALLLDNRAKNRYHLH